ncbi:StbC superfamily plasmid stability protein (plasmid) [Rhizobium etli bv. phaseoli str. IE4803]|uniref:FitA-like ribbon-helix-helix domain-containing protein n=1 Tax=Rhizobium sp. Kim5 TaxID=2020311 RepID=UPI000581EF21|nr:plasmid stabilization protein [Rhizobium sp. Kim5]AJC83243.1 StbC superfamily plasmid stability protein [Rhizobium etli bv. phaseoli str. IE4803]ARQ62046.1 StbC superfamily plasmid stability protein [Rhizobium sp. Kim5]
MASMTTHGLDDGLIQRLRMRAAAHGHSMEDEARHILRTALASSEPVARNLADAIRTRLLSVGVVELDIPSREPIRELRDFTP